MYLYLFHLMHVICATPMCVIMFPIQYVLPVCVRVSNSISTHDLSYTCVCTCIYFKQCMLSVQHLCVCMVPIHYILPMCVHMSVYYISNPVVCVCLHITHAYLSLYQYICIIKSVHITYMCTCI